MNPEFLRAFARRCRDLMMQARSAAAREQLRLWAEEFDRRAEIFERERSSCPGSNREH
jgi:hypothetical protein